MDERSITVRDMRICRFCLDENEPLTNIYEKENKQMVPLPLQIMACVAIEVFPTDGMPQYICTSCRTQTIQSYNFKTTCKKSDDALKLYLATGKLTKPSYGLIRVSTDLINKDQLDDEADPPKRPKIITIANQELLSFNFESGMELEDEEKEDEPEQILGLNSEEEPFTSIAVADEGIVTLEPDDIINPILKVPQVETDVYPCDQCERSFPLQQLLDIHIKNHERERSFACQDCGRKFFTKYDLGKHLQTHTDTKPYTCVICQKQFSRESLLHRHEKIHTDVPKYLCGCCDRTFLSREDLDSHAEKHKKKRPFACRLCNKSFVFRQGLERHELAHADQKPHKCNYCEASFTSAIKLTRHITSHAGLRPYPCKMCGRTFLLSHHLTRHMRSHYAAQSAMALTLGQHKCDVCSMSFRRKDSLINHSAIHSMVNLRCVICNTAFENAKMVKDHITTHLSGLPYPCDRCDYSFDTQDQLEDHELKHVEMEYEDQIEKEVLEGQVNEDIEMDEEYNSEELDEVAISEFTIMNSDNPEVIRRPKRDTKNKSCTDFLKDEICSDIEDEVTDQDMPEEFPEEPIKPIVRSEGTKMYTRKTPLHAKPRIIQNLKPSDVMMAPLEQITQPPIPTLETMGIAKHAASALNDKKFIDMKIGAKTIRVQKLMMTKSEIEAMAREGKIEMKGNTILLKKNRTLNQNAAQKKSANSTDLVTKLGPARKTYMKKVTEPGEVKDGSVKEPEVKSVSLSEIEINAQAV